MQPASDASCSSVSPRCKRCDCSLHSWISSLEPYNSHQNLQPSFGHRLIARIMCGKGSAAACTGRMRVCLALIKACSSALGIDSLLG